MIQSSNKEGQRESMGNSQSRPLSFGRVLKANDFDQQTFKINIRNMADEVYELDEERFYLKYLILFLLFILYGSIIAAFTTLHMQKENNIPYLSTQTQNNYIPSTKSTPETQKYRTPTIAPTQTKRPQPAKNYTYTSPKIQQNQTKSQYQHRYRRPLYQQKNILPKQQKIYETQVSNHSRTSQAHSQSSKKFLSSPPSSLNQARSKQQPNSQYSNISNHLQSPQHSQSSNYSKIPQNSYASHVQKNKRTQELSKLQQSKHLNESQPSQQFQSQHSKLQEQSSKFQEPPKSNYQVNQKSTQPQQSSESSQYQIKDTLLVNKNEQKNVIKQNNGLKLKNQRLIRHLLRPKAMIQPPFGGNFYQVWQQVFRVQCRWQSLALRGYVKKWATSPKYRKRTLYRKFLDYWKGYDESKIPEQEFYYRWHPRWNGLHKMLQNGSYWHANGNKLTVFTTTKINVDDYSVFQLFPLTWMGIWLPPDIAQNEVITIEGIRVKLNFKTMKDRPFLIEQIGKIYVNPTEKERRTKDKPIFRQFICHDGQDFCNEKYTQIRLTFVNDVRVYHIKIDSMYMVGFNFWGKYGPDQDQDYY